MAKSMMIDNFASFMATLEKLPTFAKELDMKYICEFCKNILRPPVKQTPCGHRFCAQCVVDMFGEHSESKCPGNEDECVILTPHEVRQP